MRHPIPKTTIVILLLLTFVSTSLASNPNKYASDFQISVDGFIKKYSANFTTVTETFNNDGNDVCLDNRVKSSWHKTVTLKCKTSFKNEYNQTVFQRLFLGFYQYDTDEQCSAALDSLLNCFGGDCAKFEWGDNGRSVKSTPKIYIVNKREIIVCTIYCEHINNFWKTIKHDLIMTFGNEISGIIDVGCGGPVNFK